MQFANNRTFFLQIALGKIQIKQSFHSGDENPASLKSIAICLFHVFTL